MKRQIIRRTIPVVFFLLPALTIAQGEKNQNLKWTDARGFGLRGKVRTERVTTRRIPNAPKVDMGGLAVSPPVWLVFDKNGFVVEQANQFAQDGTPKNATRNERDPQGRLIRSVSEASDPKSATETEYQYGPYGLEEVKTFQGGKLTSSTTNQYDARGNLVRSFTYDGSGELVSRSESVFDKNNRPVELTIYGGHDEVQLHSKEQFDSSGNIVERDEFDGDNRIVRSMVFQNDVLFTWTQDPAYHGSEGIAVVDSAKFIPYSYTFMSDGTLVTYVHHNPSGFGGVWNDDSAEVVDEQGNVIQSVVFQYERDPEGNWTRRVVSVLDPDTGTTTPIQEDVREITYY